MIFAPPAQFSMIGPPTAKHGSNQHAFGCAAKTEFFFVFIKAHPTFAHGKNKPNQASQN
jgi:hypothetical protein